MNDEIKEIVSMSADEDIEIKYINEKGAYVYKNIDIYELLDYITNLQEENERLKEKVNNLEMFKYNIPNDKTKIVPTITKSYKNEYETYKSRNEKALDKLYCYGEVFDSKILQEFQKEMENILNGGD